MSADLPTGPLLLDTLPAADHPVDETARRGFETAWGAGERPDLASFVPAREAPTYLGTLEELVHIDLEMVWRRRTPEAPPTPVEAYVERFPVLGDESLLVRLLAQECYVRAQHGDVPTLTDYRRRFPTVVRPDSEPEAALRAALAPAADTPTARVGRYRLLNEHARGGFGHVWRVEDPPLRRVVALKRLDERLASDPDIRARFVAEAQVTAHLDHPNIVPVHELGNDERGPYYTMKLVRGQTLDEVIRASAGTAVDRLRLVGTFVSVARTVAYAHAQGVLHRDLKPQNVIVGDFGETFLLDWGLAKIREAPESPTAGPAMALLAPLDVDQPAIQPAIQTRAGSVVGTPAYMSPEQAAGRLEAIDERSDVFSLGAILYEVLTGERAFLGADVNAVIAEVRAARVRPPRSVDPNLERPLEAICLRALALERKDRYPSARALLEDLERFQAGEPVSAYRESRLERLGRWARAHRNAVIAGGLTVVLLAIATVVGVFWSQELTRQRETEQARHLAGIEQLMAGEEASAKAALDQGDFERAAAHLQQGVALSEDEPALAVRGQDLHERQERATRLADFRRLADEAWFRSGHDPFGAAAKERARAAAAALAVSPGEVPPTDGLGSAQVTRLNADLQRLLVLLAALEATPALLDPFGEKGAAACKESVAAIDQADALGSLQVTTLLRAFCGAQQNPDAPWPDLSDIPSLQPADAYFLGFAHFWLAAFPDNGVMRLVKLLGIELPGFDLETPMVTAQRYLRAAAAAEPERYWPHYMVGWAHSVAGEHAEAELAYTTCIALRPAYQHGYLARATAVLAQAVQRRPSDAALAKRGMADIEHARQHAPHDPFVHLGEGYAQLMLHREVPGMQALLRGIALSDAVYDAMLGLGEPPGDLEVSWSAWLKTARAWADRPDGSLEGALAVAALSLVRETPETAAEVLESSRLRGSMHPAALLLRAIIGLRGKNVGPTVVGDLEAAAKVEPWSFLAHAALALAHDRAGDSTAAVAAREALPKLARTEGQRLWIARHAPR